jgi:hypothetical protein
VGAEGEERLLGAVGGRRQPVRAQADPSEERDERELMMDAGVEDVPATAEE